MRHPAFHTPHLPYPPRFTAASHLPSPTTNFSRSPASPSEPSPSLRASLHCSPPLSGRARHSLARRQRCLRLPLHFLLRLRPLPHLPIHLQPPPNRFSPYHSR